jgi:hypothetical protein
MLEMELADFFWFLEEISDRRQEEQRAVESSRR